MATASSLRRLLLFVSLTLLIVVGTYAHDDGYGGDDDDNVDNDRTFERDNLNNSAFPTRIIVNYGGSMSSSWISC